MGISMSTLLGWAVVSAIAGYYIVSSRQRKRGRSIKAAPSQAPKLEDRHTGQNRKDPKEKAKRQRVEAFSKDVEEPVKAAAQPKPRATKPAPNPAHTPDYSTDDGVDNREFARQLASVKQGTSLNAPKKDEKRQKSVKQSRARTIDEPAGDNKVSAPSSTAGADADDDESPVASPEVKAADSGDVTDMLEPKAPGPSVLRLTGTDSVKQKEKKAKAPEKVETKKQRQNRQKNEAAKALREETEQQRQVALEAQRRAARIAEGRAAKDGSSFMASQAQPSVWLSNGANGAPSSPVNGGTVQLLDTFDTGSQSDTPAPKATPQTSNKDETWMASLPSEEEQMEILRGEEAWSTVTTKKSNKSKKKEPTSEKLVEPESAATQTQPAAPQPAVAKPQKATTNGNTKTARSFTQQSSFAALSRGEPEVEVEWEV
ncbi:hypothetical protein QBC47DRAFT_156754 [Echria macrotheca]|uniref:Uncharacterized protein n=1 Tax=Echria macrotheca TaxID=438768 RepID=A0AAJ0BGA6_9PEZI|nr:hypothetical protein QBC47DRAFT_156754 [Echria macrotheca]